MKVELSKFEVELLDQALQVWESQPMTDGMMGSILGSMLMRDQPKEDRERHTRQEIEDSRQKVSKRRLQSTLLRAKLLQGLASDSEHNLEETRATPPRGDGK